MYLHLKVSPTFAIASVLDLSLFQLPNSMILMKRKRHFQLYIRDSDWRPSYWLFMSSFSNCLCLVLAQLLLLPCQSNYPKYHLFVLERLNHNYRLLWLPQPRQYHQYSCSLSPMQKLPNLQESVLQNCHPHYHFVCQTGPFHFDYYFSWRQCLIREWPWLWLWACLTRSAPSCCYWDCLGRRTGVAAGHRCPSGLASAMKVCYLSSSQGSVISVLRLVFMMAELVAVSFRPFLIFQINLLKFF